MEKNETLASKNATEPTFNGKTLTWYKENRAKAEAELDRFCNAYGVDKNDWGAYSADFTVLYTEKEEIWLQGKEKERANLAHGLFCVWDDIIEAMQCGNDPQEELDNFVEPYRSLAFEPFNTNGEFVKPDGTVERYPR